jgi:hypothetical protein
MRNVGKLTVAGAFCLLGVSTATLPAAADTLGLDLTGGLGSFVTSEQVEGWSFTVNQGITVTGLGTYDGGPGDSGNPGAVANLPIAATVELLNSAGTVLATSSVGGGSGSQVSTFWAFSSTAVSVALTTGNTYYVLALLPSTDANELENQGTGSVTVNSAVNFVGSEICNPCSSISLASLTSNTFTGTNQAPPQYAYFGGDFEFTATNGDLSATPLPATLPLFAGGLGVMGFLGRRMKRKASSAIAAA